MTNRRSNASPRPPVNPDSDAISVASCGGRDGDYGYVESTKSLPTISAITPDLVGHIIEMETMYEVLEEDINANVQPTVLFAHTNDIKISGLADAKTHPTKNHQKNGTALPLDSQPSLSQ